MGKIIYLITSLILVAFYPIEELMAKAQSKLKNYRQQRDFSQTPEPKASIAKKRQSKQPVFVIQKHAASHMHYDFRIQIGSILKSWAVPKGISSNPSEKHLAIQTEDHPLDYAEFEGVIPEGNYGAGTVMVWDIGTFENIKTKNGKLVSLLECFKRGTIEIELEGKKLHGSYALIRTKLGDGNQWLLLKMKDQYAHHRITNLNKSALTGRTMKQIGAQAPGKKIKETKKSTKPQKQNKITKKKVSTKQSKKESETTVKIGSHQVKLTNQDKVLYPKDGITKADLITYYQAVAPYMLPHMKNRAVTMHRFPDGIDSEGFYQKDISDYFPSWIKRVEIPKEGGLNTYVVCNNAETLVYLANQACITPHLWLSHIKKLNYPDRMIFDLDPGSKADFSTVRKAALNIRDILTGIGLKSFVMTTGSRGLHVVVPLNERVDFDTVRAFARQIADYVAEQNPDHFTTEARINKRKGRLFIDFTRNAYAQTSVSPYAVRAQLGAPIATPITWKELEKNRKLHSQSFTIKNIMARLKKQGDPWEKINTIKQSLAQAKKNYRIIAY